MEDDNPVCLHKGSHRCRVTQLRVLAPAAAVVTRPVSSSPQLAQPFSTQLVQGGAVSARLLLSSKVAALV